MHSKMFVLTDLQAAMIHTVAEREIKSFARMAAIIHRDGTAPTVAKIMQQGAIDWIVLREMIETRYPEFRDTEATDATDVPTAQMPDEQDETEVPAP